MKYKLNIAAIALVLMLTGCKDFLDIQPVDKVVPKTVEDYELMLCNPQLFTSSQPLSLYMTDDVFMPDVYDNNGEMVEDTLRDYIYSTYELTASPLTHKYIRNLYTFDKDVYRVGEPDPDWNHPYRRIFMYNNVLNGVIKAEGDEAHRATVKAEALIGRAFEYLILVNLYAKHYSAATANSDLAVPLRLGVDLTNTNLTRATVSQVYTQIMNDINTATPHLPLYPPINCYRASKLASWSLKAKIFLYQGLYDSALVYSNMALDKVRGKLFDYKGIDEPDMFPRVHANPESIFARTENGSPEEVISLPFFYGLRGQVYASDELTNLLCATGQPDTTADKRYSLFYENFVVQDYGEEGIDTIILEGSLRKLWFRGINIGATVPEIYLIAAECEARIGSAAKAIELLNELRDNRIVNNVPLTATTNKNALKKVIDERRREFALVGIYRLIDLKRYNLDPETRVEQIVHRWGGQLHTLPANSGKYVLPIPPQVLIYNPDMPDNDRN